jgi:hypothetical protein
MAVAVALTDSPVQIVDFQLSSGVATDHPRAVHSLRFGGKVTAGSLGAAAPNVPSPAMVGHDMMSFGSAF